MKEAYGGYFIRLYHYEFFTSMMMVYTWWWCSVEVLYVNRLEDDDMMNVMAYYEYVGLWYHVKEYDDTRLNMNHLCALLWHDYDVFISKWTVVVKWNFMQYLVR